MATLTSTRLIDYLLARGRRSIAQSIHRPPTHVYSSGLPSLGVVGLCMCLDLGGGTVLRNSAEACALGTGD